MNVHGDEGIGKAVGEEESESFGFGDVEAGEELIFLGEFVEGVDWFDEIEVERAFGVAGNE